MILWVYIVYAAEITKKSSILSYNIIGTFRVFCLDVQGNWAFKRG